MATSRQSNPVIFQYSTDNPQKKYFRMEPGIQLAIYLYRNGKENCSLPGYSAVYVKFKSDRTTFPGVKIQWVFQCGGREKKSPLYYIDELIQMEECIAFNNLFRFTEMAENDIKFIVTITTNKPTQTTSSRDCKQDTTSSDDSSRKRKCAIKDCDDPNAKKKRKIDTNLNGSNEEDTISTEEPNKALNWNHTKCREVVEKHRNDCKNHCVQMKLNNNSNFLSQHETSKLNEEYLIKGIRKICKKLDMEPWMPDVDCFASHNSHQDTRWYITKEDNFWSDEYDCKEFWNKVIAWSYPPYDKLVDTIKMYKTREMKGYICGDWDPNEEERDRNDWYRYAKQYLKHSEHIGNGFDAIICYFDFCNN